jgi:hypothetical protein
MLLPIPPTGEIKINCWLASSRLQNAYRDDAFYAQFGATRAEVAPIENWFLKLFCAVHRKEPQDATQVS